MHIPSTNDYNKKVLIKIDIYFLIKKEKVFIKCMKILEKVKNIKNKFKKYLKAKKINN